ncbi:MAG TPA: hypothetical protein VMT45_03020 [Thermoanaerobaculaceae bacterium]|nr:hypothetical protein [Thermoanaerobaculaceae bacterium]
MRKPIVAMAVVAVLALGLAGSLAWAAGAVSVNVPFSFIVKDKEMPAGNYAISEESGRLLVKGSGGTVATPILERLADTGTKEPKIVFDKVEGKSYLSEVHIPGADGYLVGIAKGKETHVTVTGKE